MIRALLLPALLRTSLPLGTSLLLGAGLLGISLLLTGCADNTAAAAPRAAVPTGPADSSGREEDARSAEPVLAGRPVRKSLKLTTTQPARIEAFEDAPLYARVEGYVGDVLVDIGDTVTQGQVLLRISVPELQDDLRQKQALVAQAQAERGQAQAAETAAVMAHRSVAALVSQAQAGLARAEANADRWKAEAERIDALAASGSVTQKVADETRNQARAAAAERQEAAAAIQSAEAGVGEAEAGIAKAKADVVAAEARLAVAEAKLQRARTMLRYAEIVAPFDGIITQRSVSTGHFVSVGAGGAAPLLSVARSDRVRVFLDVPEIEAARVTVGDAATIAVQALGSKTIEGDVTRTAWALDSANRSLRTEVDLENPHGELRPGMYATATLLLESRSDALTLPEAAVARTAEGVFCFVIREGQSHKTPIRIGLRVGPDFEVLSGLTGEETVALAKATSLADGQPVEPITP